MTRRASMAAVVCLGVSLCGGRAWAQDTVAVEVVDVAGDRAYVQPGETAGVRRGSPVALRDRRYEVIAATGGYAVILHDGHVRVGDRGQATVVSESAEEVRRLPAPEPLAAFAGQWPDASRPADHQHPRPVPLGPVSDAARSFAALSLAEGAMVPLSGGAKSVERGEARARVHVEPFRESPLRLDADAAAQLWLAEDLDQRAGDDSRFPVRVRQLEAAYGDAAATFAALGRLRYASRTLGMLDGARAQAEVVDGFTLGAFGGLVPDPLDGMPASDASRFGAEVGYEVPEAELRPRLSLTGHGSYFDGGIDERRLVAAANVFPDDAHAGAYAELSLYDRDNPWGVNEQELSAAGADGSATLGIVELGARVDLQRPERSRWLAAFLPPGFLCTTRDPIDDMPCFGDDARYLGGLDATVTLDRVSFGGSLDGSTSERGGAEQVGGAVRTRVLDLVGPVRLDVALLASEGALVHMLGARVALGAEIVCGVLDVSLHHQPAVTRYDADTANYVEHMFGTAVWWAPAEEFELALDADTITGRDVDVLLVHTSMTVRPEF